MIFQKVITTKLFSIHIINYLPSFTQFQILNCRISLTIITFHLDTTPSGCCYLIVRLQMHEFCYIMYDQNLDKK